MHAVGFLALERVTVTVDSHLLSSVDALVEKRKAKSRSHAFDILLRRALAGEELRKAVLLAGGPAEVLLEHHSKQPKPLLDIAGIPVVERTIMHLKKHGLEEIVACLGHSGEKIVSRLQNGEQLGVKISYAWENAQAPLGSAGALRLAQKQVDEPFLFSYSDVLYDALDLGDLYQFHKRAGGACTLALADAGEAASFGVAVLSGSKIVDFTEKPSRAQSHLVNAGVAVCEPEVFSFIPKNSRMSFEKELLPLLARKGKLFGYAYSGKWFDVGRPGSLEEARKYFARK